jgi:hypothetical protein
MPGDVDDATLSVLQADADDGWYRLVIAAYAQWLAPHRDEVLAWFDRRVAEVRAGIGRIPDGHDRHPEAVAQLQAALELFLTRFAVESGLIGRLRAEDVVATIVGHLRGLLFEQADDQRENRTGAKFLAFIRADIKGHRTHLAPMSGVEPMWVPPVSCGFRLETVYVEGDQTPVWRLPPRSDKVGYVDEENKLVYLVPSIAEEHAIETARKRGDTTDFVDVGRHLLAEGLVEPEVEKRKDGKTVRRAKQNRRITAEGTRGTTRCYVFTFDNFFGPHVEDGTVAEEAVAKEEGPVAKEVGTVAKEEGLRKLKRLRRLKRRELKKCYFGEDFLEEMAAWLRQAPTVYSHRSR